MSKGVVILLGILGFIVVVGIIIASTLMGSYNSMIEKQEGVKRVSPTIILENWKVHSGYLLP